MYADDLLLAWAPTLSQAKEAAAVKTKFMPEVGEHPEKKVAPFLEEQLYQEQARTEREKEQASESHVGEASRSQSSSSTGK